MQSKEIFLVNLRHEMKRLRMTQVQLARACGLPQPRIAEILSGKFSPRLDTLDKLAAALEITPASLLLPLPEVVSRV